MAESVMVRKSFLKKLMERGRQAAPVVIETTRRVGRGAAQLARRGASATGRELVSDKNGIFTVGIGALAAYITNSEAVKNSEFFKKTWWTWGILMVAVGYALSRKQKPYGKTLMALGGMVLMQGYQNQPKDKDKSTETKKETKGFDWQEQTAFPAPYGAQWVVSADGRHILMPARQYEQYQPNALPPKREKADAIGQMADAIYGRNW
jgi:hypothetical protein